MASNIRLCDDGECRNIKTNNCKNIEIKQYKSGDIETMGYCETLSIYLEDSKENIYDKIDKTLKELLNLPSGNFSFGKDPKQFLVLFKNIEDIIKNNNYEHDFYPRLEEVRKKFEYVIDKSTKNIPIITPVKEWSVQNLDSVVLQTIDDKLGANSSIREHQKRPAAYLLENDRLLAVHGTGTGKTLVAILAAEIFIKNNSIKDGPPPRVIFTSPPGLITNFENTLETKLQLSSENYQLLNYNDLVRLQKRGDYDGSNTLLIIDEVHNLRNPKSEKTKHIVEVSYKSTKVLMLTATPFVNNFTDFVPIINMLYGGELLGVNKDFSKYWKVSEGVNNERFNNNLEKIGKYLKDRIDYFPTDYTDENFPQIREEKKYVEMKSEYLQPYTDLLKGRAEDLMKIYYVLNPGDNPDFDENESFKIVFDNPTVFYNGCRRLVNTLYKSPGTLEEFYLLEIYISEKINQAISIIKNNESKKTIIYTNWINQGIEPIKTVLDSNGYKGKYQIYTGSISMEERDDIVKKYNDPSELGAEILIMSSAGSEGIDLKFTNNVIVIDPPWNKANLEQIVGRAARYKSHEGLEDKFVNVYYMILTTPAETNQLIAENKLAEEKSDESNKIKLGDVLLYDIIEEKNKTTIEVNKVFRQICINSMGYTALPIIDTEPDKILADKLQLIAAEEPEEQRIVPIEPELISKEKISETEIAPEETLAAEQPIIPMEPELTSKEEISETEIAPEETLTEEDYLQIFKEFINNEDREALEYITMRQLKDKIRQRYISGRKSRTFNRAYNSNKQEILQRIRTKLYPELS